MSTKKQKVKLMKQKICAISRVVACASFLILTIIAVSSLVRAMSLENISNENGVPSSWETASLGNPDTITVPITYWDQRQDDCDDPNRQFEWVLCNYWTAGAVQGIIKDHLGADNLPIPAFVSASDAWKANLDVFSANVTGNDPVQPTDNFYRWFHDTPVSQHYDREVTFTRTGHNTYTYGETNVFPMDNVDFSNGDSAWHRHGHNYHFTAHLSFATKIAADGTELFEFSGDDDVWVFLNGKLVLDIGGLHEKLDGSFKINTDGTISTYVQHVNDTSARASLPYPSNDYNNYVNPLNELVRATYQDKYETIDVGLKPGDIVNLDFFYAERSTTESNTKITISNMNWPISADSEINTEIVGKLPENNSNLVQHYTSITNRDPLYPLNLERLAAYINESSTDEQGNTIQKSGYIPLDASTLSYTTTPDIESSWQPVEISAPSNNASGFNLATPIQMTPNGTPGDTLYFRYLGETSSFDGTMTSLISYYTTLNGEAGVTYDYATVDYQAPVVNTEHNITIKYLYEDDTPAAEEYHATLKPGEPFTVDSPKIEDYIADISIVEGTMGEEDLVYIVRYAPKPVNPEPVEPENPKTYKLIIHYIYEDGSPAADTFTATYEPATDFAITSPEINEHTPDFPLVKGTIEDKDLEYIVRYKKNPAPVTPPEPSIPDQTLPQAPNIPYIPPSNIIDGNLFYLAPLGQVAFIPNTGVVSSTIAAVFDEGFAEVILSQAFVMVTLLIFAASFATYFSLRRFLNFELSTVKVTASAKQQKSSAKTRKKSYTKMTKSNTRTTSNRTKSASSNTRSNKTTAKKA